MNRSDVKRGLGIFDDLESFEIEQAKKEEPDLEEIREIRLAYQKKKDEFERWIKGQEKLTDTDIQNKVDQMTQLEAEGIVQSWFDKILNPLGWESGTAASRIYDWTRKRKKEELPEPATLVEFEETVGLLDEEEAKTYYEKWKNKW